MFVMAFVAPVLVPVTFGNNATGRGEQGYSGYQ
jgi:hypothetical protein